VLLADRVLVLADGVLGLEVTVDVPRPRSRSDRRALELREHLLAELGVAP
jgi:sulfonate transport system ATP-binding protein